MSPLDVLALAAERNTLKKQLQASNRQLALQALQNEQLRKENLYLKIQLRTLKMNTTRQGFLSDTVCDSPKEVKVEHDIVI